MYSKPTKEQQNQPTKPRQQTEKGNGQKAASTLQTNDFASLPAQEMLQMHRLFGNQQLAALVQRKEADPPEGYGVSTEFGEYWVVPDGTLQSHFVEAEQIAESSFEELEETWDALQGDTGQIQIEEKDVTGKSHAGFKNLILEQFGMLLARPIGRALVIRLVNEETETITIRPSAAGQVATAEQELKDNGNATVDTDAVIELDPDLKDDAVLVYDANGAEIVASEFQILGYELINAENHVDGSNKWGIPPSDPAYDDAEEAATLAGTTIMENLLRAEQEYVDQFGQLAQDTQEPDAITA